MAKYALPQSEEILYNIILLFYEFRSFRSITTIAGPGGVIGPLPMPNKSGRTTKKAAKRPGILKWRNEGFVPHDAQMKPRGIEPFNLATDVT